MEYLFPKQTPYEIVDNSLSNANFKLFEPIKKEEKLYEKTNKHLNKKEYKFSEFLLFLIVIILFFIKFIINQCQI